MQYRKDIDGLRAIAVSSVILFHAGFQRWLPGGFFGVDIFFVISGFLIGRILFTEIEQQRYSIWRFYERRARRILPALLLVLLVSYGLARWLYGPLEYADFRNSLLATLGFGSNIYFWLHSGYFEAASELKPLLHTWSLGVEEQYYILFPLLVYALRNTRWRIHMLLLCTALSFAWAVATVSTHPNAAFYLLPARAWELLLGALGAVWASRQTLAAPQRQALSLLGLVLISVSLVFFHAKLRHPGFYTLVPTIGTLLVLAAQAPGGIATRLLQLSPMVLIGHISYSAYLWHQPVFAFWMHRFGQHSLQHYALPLIALTALLAYATWRWVENPTRNTATTSVKRLALLCAVPLAVLATALLPQSWLLQHRNNEALQELARIDNLYDHFEFQKHISHNVCHTVPMAVRKHNGCLQQRSKNLVLFGDSYAASMVAGLQAVRDARYPDYSIIQLTDGNAPPFFIDGQIDGGASLMAINEEKLRVIAAIQPQKILMTWMAYGKNSTNDLQKELAVLHDSIARLRAVSPNSEIIVVGQFPHWSVSLAKNLMDYLAQNNHFPRHMRQGLDARYQQWDEYFRSHLDQPHTRYLSAQQVLCEPSGCLTSVDGSVAGLTAVDWGHLTKAGSIYLAEQLAPRIFE